MAQALDLAVAAQEALGQDWALAVSAWGLAKGWATQAEWASVLAAWVPVVWAQAVSVQAALVPVLEARVQVAWGWVAKAPGWAMQARVVASLETVSQSPVPHRRRRRRHSALRQRGWPDRRPIWTNRSTACCRV